MSNFINKYSLGIVCDLTAYSLVNEIRKIELEEPFFQFKNISELSWENQEKKLLKIYKKIEN